MEGRGPEAAAVSTANLTASRERAETLARVDQASSMKTTTASAMAFSAAEGGKRGQAKNSRRRSGGGAQQDEGKAEGDEAWTPKLAAQLGQRGGVSEQNG